MSIILKNVNYIDYITHSFIPSNLLIHEGENGGMEFYNDIASIPEKDSHDIYDCKGKYATKSFAIGHHHIYSALSRGMPVSHQLPANFREILEFIWWKLDKRLDSEMIRASAMAAAIDCVRCGSTFIIDHHASPNAISGSLEIIADVFDEIGISHLLCYEISDRDGMDKTVQGLDETANYLSKNQGLVGMHASFTVSDNTMRKAADLCEKYNSGAHIHVAEDVFDQKHCMEKYGKRVVERLHDYGFINLPQSLFIHALHLSENEKKIIRNGKAWVVENIESNLNNNVGHFNGEGLGANIFYGTDGMHGDMIRSAQSAFFNGTQFENPDINETYCNLRNVHRYLNENNFAGDGNNNLVIMDYPAPTPFDAGNFHGHFIFGWSSNYITDVISNGKFILKNRHFTTINQNDWLAYSREQTLRLWEKLK
jgi:cytosine/adenosine deaminase-related metal-dependent hydrolase